MIDRVKKPEHFLRFRGMILSSKGFEQVLHVINEINKNPKADGFAELQGLAIRMAWIFGPDCEQAEKLHSAALDTGISSIYEGTRARLNELNELKETSETKLLKHKLRKLLKKIFTRK